ncbi:hypothetical protein ACHRVW_00620 [Flavobacterium collinsii]|uniref:hypothetical protein n=1 Tax=Flavobacterium collinsii TaxID=1114861 RepID=UPI0022C155B1|nr:hypothetical protein [Flavobacterium collinsii]GIQ60449.1 hypothetical protein Flavo103_35850 [Flavobacterium collinsii]
MKKTALVLGIFSLVMVATSFVNPATVLNNKNCIATDGSGGQKTGGTGTRKQDVQSAQIQLKSFAAVSQSTRTTIKLD